MAVEQRLDMSVKESPMAVMLRQRLTRLCAMRSRFDEGITSTDEYFDAQEFIVMDDVDIYKLLRKATFDAYLQYRELGYAEKAREILGTLKRE